MISHKLKNPDCALLFFGPKESIGENPEGLVVVFPQTSSHTHIHTNKLTPTHTRTHTSHTQPQTDTHTHSQTHPHPHPHPHPYLGEEEFNPDFPAIS